LLPTTSRLEVELDYSGRKGRDRQKNQGAATKYD